MKIILVKDVPGTGAAGEIREVKEGHARNYLIPRGLAVPASDSAVRALTDKKQAVERRAERQRHETEELIDRMRGLVLEIRGRAGEGGRLFGSVTSQQIADALTKKGFQVSRKQVELDEPIRVEGFYRVPVRVAPGTLIHIDLNVVGTK
jgi:large subunit ribosomal protein L9